MKRKQIRWKCVKNTYAELVEYARLLHLFGCRFAVLVEPNEPIIGLGRAFVLLARHHVHIVHLILGVGDFLLIQSRPTVQLHDFQGYSCAADRIHAYE